MVCSGINLTANSSLTSSSTYNYGRHEYCPEYAFEHVLTTIVAPTLSVLIMVVGLVGNLLVIATVTCNPQMRTTTNILITNLAFADLFFMLSYVPFKAWDFAVPHWIFGDVACKFIYYVLIVSNYATIYTLMLMTVDRFLAIVYPVKTRSFRTRKHTYRAIACKWVVVLCCCIPAIPTHGEMIHDFNGKEFSECVFLTDTYRLDIAMICFSITAYFVPLSLIFCLYIVILRTLWSNPLQPNNNMDNLKSKKRGTRMVIIVVLVFAICWGPLVTVLLLKSHGLFTLSPAKLLFEIIAYLLAYANSCTNPFLYALLSENFRKGFKKVIYCTPRFNKSTDS